MKSLFKLFANLFNYLRNFRTIRKFEKINIKLHKTIEDREVDRIILKGNIIKMVRKYLRIDAKSKYIPKESRNNTEIRERILAEFGEQMDKLGIRINNKLELK
ncbi:hypothetical protein [Flavobacterium taihuense]|uniref:Uncharacterized protein n=1 Tax=Flavobacterium taihuense TaxID=2857508 RepID=A0ABS6Y0Q0_9FLAO|nr:hypothetical protein [Flavobacterium taihuense]MBW4362489.1 hypothetical protein [Flavobacterium taihuense]